MVIATCFFFFGLMSCSPSPDNPSGSKQAGSNSSGSNSSGSKPTPVERVDPRSAPLFPSTTEASAPLFRTALLDGTTFDMQQTRGSVIIMNIWATWCAPCKKETPDLVSLYEAYREDGLMIVGVSVDEQGESVVVPFVEEYQVTYPIIIDRSGEVMDLYGPTMGIPTTYIIDREGHFRYFATGAVTKTELLSKIKPLLEEGNSNN
jgi:peroxiredoxin